MAVLSGLMLGVALAATAAEPTAKAQATATAVFAGGHAGMTHGLVRARGIL